MASSAVPGRLIVIFREEPFVPKKQYAQATGATVMYQHDAFESTKHEVMMLKRCQATRFLNARFMRDETYDCVSVSAMSTLQHIDSAANSGRRSFAAHSFNTSTACTSFCNRMRCRSNLPLRLRSARQSIQGKHQRVAFKFHHPAATEATCATQEQCSPTFPLTYRFDRSHVDRATGSVADITGSKRRSQ